MIVLSKFFYPKNDCNLIRLGNNNDGGYVVEKNSITNSELLLSFGLSDDWSFESDFSKFGNKTIYSYDYSVNARFWIVRLIKNLISIFILRDVRINFKNFFSYFGYRSFFDNKKNFHIKKFIFPLSMKKNVLKKNDTTDINEILKDIDKKVFLKIDIEGAEYRILDQIINNEKKIKGLVVEFHDFDLNQNIVKSFIESLKLKLVHIHVNNYGTIDSDGTPSTVELSFTSREFLVNSIMNDKTYPVKNLDKPCNKNDIDHKITFR